VSTRRVDDLVVAMGGSGISKSEVSRICAQLDTDVAAWRARPLDEIAFPYVFLDATYCKTRVNMRVVSQAVVIATGVSADGRREVLGCAVGDSETEAFWTEFLRSLRDRGLGGVQLVISDSHRGLTNAISTVLQGAAWQPGPLHAQRPGQGQQDPSGDGRGDDPHDLRPAQRRHRPRARRRHRRHPHRTLPRRRGAAARREGRPDRLRGLPARALAQDLVDQPDRAAQPRGQAPHRCCGIFPNPDALLRLAGCVLIEAHDEWQDSDRRYLSEESMALLNPPPPTALEPRRDDTSEVMDQPALQTA
jgi:putative transposase